jgi:acetyl esterase/lipase
MSSDSRYRLPGTTFTRRRIGALVGIGVVGAVFTGLLNDTRRVVDGVLEWPDTAFYGLPDPIPDSAPGTIYRQEELGSAPTGTRAWRVLYHSRDRSDTNILVSGLVVVPDGPAPEAGRPIVSWAHPTTGIAPHCAPSAGIDPFILIEGMHDFLDAGYVIAATDYSGMGAAGPDAYLVGLTEGHNVLDVARAARSLPEAAANDHLVLWGHSQGGHAVLFAGHLASAYAPEFRLRGAAVAAPAAEIAALMRADIGDMSGVTIGSYAFITYNRVYGAPLDVILTPEAIAATEEIGPVCLLTHMREIHEIATPFVGHYVKADPGTVEPWASILAENTPPAERFPVPLFVAQGDTDTLVRPEITATFVAQQVELGADVTFVKLPDTGHGLVADRALRRLMEWLATLPT